ncbi:hypothetical protein [Cytobacillus oceanisediminis]|uniref:hypothetical protein n=1 Tax=Cytobacillus oceanisediminis TaxID=665099 RepID=UPI003736CB2E
MSASWQTGFDDAFLANTSVPFLYSRKRRSVPSLVFCHGAQTVQGVDDNAVLIMIQTKNALVLSLRPASRIMVGAICVARHINEPYRLYSAAAAIGPASGTSAKIYFH